MSKDKDIWNVELRFHFENENGEDDYSENDHEFTSKEAAMKFANEHAGHVHDVLYYKAGTNSNPKSIW